MLLQASSYPLSKNQLPDEIAFVSKKGTSTNASTFVAEIKLTILALPKPSTASMNWSTFDELKILEPAVISIVPSTAEGVIVELGFDVVIVNACLGIVSSEVSAVAVHDVFVAPL